VAIARGIPVARDDAQDIGIFARKEIDFPLAFDHQGILKDYFRQKKYRKASGKGG
jgi:argininosuccinate lyase/8-oxo-dGTP diphosphatase